MTRRRRNILIVASVVVLGAVAGWTLWPVGRPFDHAAWHDETRVREGVRLAMADRMVARRVLTAKTRADVVAMLGDPPKEGYFKDWDLVYWLGPERGWMGIDSEWLVVRFDGNNRVSEFRIVRD